MLFLYANISIIFPIYADFFLFIVQTDTVWLISDAKREEGGVGGGAGEERNEEEVG